MALLATLVFQLVFFSSLALRSRVHRLLGFIVLLIIAWAALFAGDRRGRGKEMMGYGTLMLAQLLMASDYLGLTEDLEKEFTRVGESKAAGNSAGFGYRLKRGFDLALDPRSVVFQRRNEPDQRRRYIFSGKTTQLGFLLERVVILAGCYAYFYSTSWISKPRSIPGFLWGFMASAVYVTRVVAYCNFLHCGVVSLMVGLGAWEQKDCPWLFGNWRDGWCVSRVWGRVWHQILRRPLVSHASFMASCLFKRDADAFLVTRSILALVLSGVLHQMIASVIPRPATNTQPQTFPDLQFFALQVIGIIIERLFLPNRRTYIGYAWTVLWISISVQIHMNACVALGLMRVPGESVGRGEFSPPDMWRTLMTQE